MDMLYKKRPQYCQMHPDDEANPHNLDQDAYESRPMPAKPGRELVHVHHQGTRCYRLEKTRCGKKSCRCAGGELHGPYWYAYYRENGRMRCKYMGKTLPESVNLENRARKACREAEAQRVRAAKIVAEVRDTLRMIARFNGVPKPAEPPWMGIDKISGEFDREGASIDSQTRS